MVTNEHGPGTAAKTAGLTGPEPPPGNHALEVAARAGIGPLSPLGHEVWHGQAKPCASCGQLVRRDRDQCHHCGQDLSDEMIEKMRAHAGPWYVLEHVRPFPGVSLERIVRQIRRGVLTETSIVRGPATDFQWRFAVETPGLCRYFNRCWNCHDEISPADSHCPACLSHLAFERPQPRATDPPQTTRDRFFSPAGDYASEQLLRSSARIEELSIALDGAAEAPRSRTADHPARIGRFSVAWIVGLMLVAAIILLVWLTRVRGPLAPPRSDDPARHPIPASIETE